MLGYGRQIAQNEASYIKHPELPVAQITLQNKSEKIVRHHVKEQMRPVAVYQAAGYDGVPTLAA